MTAQNNSRRGRGRPGTPVAERASYRPPIKTERMDQVRAYAKAHGLGVADAVDVLLAGGLEPWLQEVGRASFEEWKRRKAAEEVSR